MFKARFKTVRFGFETSSVKVDNSLTKCTWN